MLGLATMSGVLDVRPHVNQLKASNFGYGVTMELIVPWHMSPSFECQSEEDFISKWAVMALGQNFGLKISQSF